MLQTCGKPYGNACYAGYTFSAGAVGKCLKNGLNRVPQKVITVTFIRNAFGVSVPKQY